MVVDVLRYYAGCATKIHGETVNTVETAFTYTPVSYTHLVIAAEVYTDAGGNFNFGSVAEGEYHIVTKSKGWQLWWPVKVTSSKPMEACNQPLLVELSVGGCGGSVSKKG